MAFSSGFAQGFSTVDAAMRRKREQESQEEIRKIMQEAPVTSMTAPKVAFDDEGNTMPSAPTTRFLGKDIEGVLNDSQKRAMQDTAVLDVVKRTDPLRAMQVERQMENERRTAARQEKMDARDDARFEREEARAKQEDEYNAARRNLSANLSITRQQQDFAKKQSEYEKQLEAYEARYAAGDRGASLGIRPTAPSAPEYTDADRINDSRSMFELQAKFGKLTPEQTVQYGDMLKKIRDEGAVDGLQALQSGASLDEFAKRYNSTGNAKFNPTKILSDEFVGGKDGPKSRVIRYLDQNGKEQTINALATLDAYGKADKAYTRFFQEQDLGIKRDKNAIDREEASARIQDRRDKADEKVKDGNARVALLLEKEPNASPAKIDAARRGQLKVDGSTTSQEPYQVRLAQAYMRATPGLTEAEALEKAGQTKNESPDKVRKDLFSTFVKELGNVDRAKAETDKSMAYLFPQGTKGAASQTDKPAASGNDAMIQEAKDAVARGASKEAVNKRLKEKGLPPLP